MIEEMLSFFGGICCKYNRLLSGTKEISQLDCASRTSGNEDKVIFSDPSDDKDLYKIELILEMPRLKHKMAKIEQCKDALRTRYCNLAVGN